MLALLLLACDADPTRPFDTAAGDTAADDAGSTYSDQAACDPAAEDWPARQLRLLTRREYSATVRDLFGFYSGEACDPWSVLLFGYGEYSGVHIAGEFNGWAPTVADGGWPLTWDEDSGGWRGEFALDPGSYQYKFVLGEQDWIADPDNPVTADDGYGGANSVVTEGCTPGEIYDPAEDFPVESRPEGYLYDNSAEAGLVTSTHADRYMTAAAEVAARALEDTGAWLPCDEGDDEATCAERFAREFGLRALRRPLSEEEVGRYRDRVLAGTSFDEGLSIALQVMLMSPDFLYRFEVGEPLGDGSYRLTPYETAAAMSYLYWGSGPDRALLDAAAAGTLDTAEGIATEARRLLEDERARELVGVFAAQWLGIEPVLTTEKSDEFGAFDELRQDMLDETSEFVRHVVFDRGGRLEELLRADYTIATDELAALYGVAGPGTGGMGLIELGDDRSGILSHASVLATTAHSDQTSPILRGLWVRERLLCQELGTPPANAGTVPEIDEDATTRERYEQHTADPSCYACHQYIDDVGFGFENFDPIGAWRDTDMGMPVDAQGDMNDVEGIATGTSAPYYGVDELAEILLSSERLGDCVTRQVWRFAMGGEETDAQACALEEVEDSFVAADRDITELLVSVATHESFTRRR